MREKILEDPLDGRVKRVIGKTRCWFFVIMKYFHVARFINGLKYR